MFELKLTCNGMPEASVAALNRAVKRRLEERYCSLSDSGFSLIVSLNGNETGEYFRITGDENHAEIVASDTLNAFFGVGRFLMLAKYDGKGGFVPPRLPIEVKPKCSLRGMYLASHFYNFYHAAPMNEIYDTVEDLALRGCNALMLCFAVQHYKSFRDPAAVEFVSRMKTIFRYADVCGMAPAIILFSNSGFSDTPAELLAEQHQQGAYTAPMHWVVNTDICPSKPGGMELIEDCHRQFFEAFADTPIKYFAYWPYDESGCTCDACAPWSLNGYMRIAEHCVRMIKEYGYNAKVIISTWHFDRRLVGEWDAFYKKLEEGEYQWADYIMTCFQSGNPVKCVRDGGVPQGRRFINFPEISMFGAKPWGGYGANPIPMWLDNADARCGEFSDGGFPYSEGIYEDMNKWICLAQYSGLYRNTTEAVRDYLRYEFLCDEEHEEELLRAVNLMEMSIRRSDKRDENGVYTISLRDAVAVRETLRIIQETDASLPETIRKCWRWRLMVIRAEIDAELYRVGYVPSRSELIQKDFAEIISTFHTENALYAVKPPMGL